MFRDRVCLCGDRRELTKIHFLFRLALCSVVFALVGPATEAQAGEHPKPPVKIGVLADLTGSWSTLGKNTVSALQIAANKIQTETNGRSRFQLPVRDTHLDPSKALEAIRDLDQRGVKIVIGLQSSSKPAIIMA
jgi:ABC-type branched-subunit amino acid transport system substrate-binding protein